MDLLKIEGLAMIALLHKKAEIEEQNRALAADMAEVVAGIEERVGLPKGALNATGTHRVNLNTGKIEEKPKSE